MFNGFRCSLMLKFDLANNFTKTSQKGNKITKLGADKSNIIFEFMKKVYRNQLKALEGMGSLVKIT